jgi:hypothetical protein
MDYNKDKVDEMVLALLYLTNFKDRKDSPYKAWKGLDWDVLNRLYEKDYIYDPKNKNKSVMFTEDGFVLCKQLFQKYFSFKDQKE